MSLMQGLASYEIYKTGFIIIIMLCSLCCAVSMTINNFLKNYQKTDKCNIKLNSDKTEILTYTVSKEHIKNIPSVTTTDNKTHVTTTLPKFNEGPCTVYYPKNNHEEYNVNNNPTIITGIISGIICCLAFLTFLWFLFLRSNREVAGVVGGIDAAHTIFSFGRNY